MQTTKSNLLFLIWKVTHMILSFPFVIHLISPTAQDNPTHQSYLQTEIPALASFYSSVCWMMKLEHYFPTWEHLKPAKILRVLLRLAK